MAPDRTTTIFETPGPSNGRKRQLRTPGSVQDFRSHKKRRMSMASVDISAENPFGQRKTLFSCESAPGSTSSLQNDRFIPVRPESVVPLTISPRTNRMYKTFGMLGANRLSFKDENQPPSSSSASLSKTGGKENSAFDLLRKSASTLVKKSKHVNESSVAQNLALNPRSFMALDSPALSNSVYSCPISWSSHNLIAVACGPEVYYQNLDTRKVARFFRAGDASIPFRGAGVREVTHISWGSGQHSTYLAAANDTSFLEVYDAGKGAFLNSVLSLDQDVNNPSGSIGCLSWNDHQLTWADHKDIYVLDVRTKPDKKLRLHGDSPGSRHGTSIAAMAWNGQGSQLASGDIDGVVHIWDVRAQKMLTERGKLGRMKHGGPVKSIAWCPWKSDLLATGTLYPEGTIRTWNIKGLSKLAKFEPEKVIRLKTAVNSLVWSPTCKELLSVHGISFEEPSPVRRHARLLGLSMGSRLPGTSNPPTRTQKKDPPKIVQTEFTNSVLVHDYPSCKRLLTLSHAHRHSITAACLGPNGQDVFTASPKDEAIKCWRVWAKPPSPLREIPFSTNSIIR